MKRGTPRHPKLIDFVKRLDQRPQSIAAAVGYLELLWHFTSEFAPQGDIGRFSDDQIEAACDWTGKRGKLLGALRESGWVDESPVSRLLVHDWHDHCDDATRKRLQRAKLPFLTGQPVKEFLTGQRQTTADNGSLPYLALPSPTPLPRRTMAAAEYPKTDAAVGKHFQSADGLLVLQIVKAVVQEYHSIKGPKIPEPDDEAISEAVEIAFKENENRQTSAGLFLTTVPKVIQSWARRGKPVARAPTSPYSDDQILTPEKVEEQRRKKFERDGLQ